MKWRSWSNWEDLVTSWGYKVLDFQSWGDYQGDHVVFLERGDGSKGFVVIGYGSCSGCDALEAAEVYEYGKPKEERTPWYEQEGIKQVSEQTRREIIWRDTWDEIIEWLYSDEAKGRWWLYGNQKDKAKAIMEAL